MEHRITGPAAHRVEQSREQRRAEVLERAQRLARRAERHGLRLRLRLARAM